MVSKHSPTYRNKQTMTCLHTKQVKSSAYRQCSSWRSVFILTVRPEINLGKCNWLHSGKIYKVPRRYYLIKSFKWGFEISLFSYQADFFFPDNFETQIFLLHKRNDTQAWLSVDVIDCHVIRAVWCNGDVIGHCRCTCWLMGSSILPSQLGIQ